MKILIPILGFGRAGGYRVLSEFANHWVRQGHTVDFLAPETSDEPYFPTIAGTLWARFDGSLTANPLHRYPANRFRGFANVVAPYRALKRVGSDYDIVLANHSFTAWSVRLARVGKAKRFYYIQAYEPEYFLQEKYLFAWALAKASYELGMIQIVNAPLYRNFKNIRTDNVVPPGIDLNLFHPKAVSKVFLNAREVTLGCIGRHEPSKGTRYVLEAFERLWQEDKRYRLCVAYGNLPQEWNHEACEVVVPKNDDELADFYRSVDILIAPVTVQHGAPHYPVMEALACGTPVITTGHMPASSSNSWLVPNRDAAAIAQAVRAIAADPNYGARIVQGLEDIKLFAWENLSKAMLELFSEVSSP